MPPAAKPCMLLVLGVHRSGTSVAAKLLECLGAVNSSTLMPPVPGNNEKGFFEDYDVYKFNEFRLLPALQAAWHSLGFIDWTNLSGDARSKFALEALGIIRKNYNPSNQLSVLKEPRIGILLPFWLSILQHAGYAVKVVCVLRDPLSVAHSLARRDGFSTSQSGMIFLVNWISILLNIQDYPVGFIGFDEIFQSPSKVLRGVSDKLGIPVPIDFDSRIASFAGSFLDPSLRHGKHELKDIHLDPDMPKLAVDLYEVLLGAAHSQNIKKTGKFAANAEATLLKVKPILRDFDGRYAQLVSLEKEKIEFQKNADFAKLLEEEARLRGDLAERITVLESLREKLASDLEVQKQGNLEAGRRIEELGLERSALLGQKTGMEAQPAAVASERDSLAAECGKLAEKVALLESLRENLSADLEAKKREKQESEQRMEEIRLGRGAQAGEKSGVEAQFAAVASERDSLAIECGKLAERVALLESLRENASADLEAQKQKTQEAEHRIGLLLNGTSEAEARCAALASDRDRLASERAGFEGRLKDLQIVQNTLSEVQAQRDALSSEKSGLELECAALSAELDRRFDEIVVLGKKLLATEDATNRREAELLRSIQSIESRWTWKIGAPLRFIFDKIRSIVIFLARLPVALRILVKHRRSGMFDHNWYLNQNPDVKNSTSRPFIHFAFHGVFEGRSPNPFFKPEDHPPRGASANPSRHASLRRYLL